MSAPTSLTAADSTTPRRGRLFLWVTGGVLVASAAAASVWLSQRPTPTPSDPWLARVHDIADQFPPGYEVGQTAPMQITQEYLDHLQQAMAGATFIPPECAKQATTRSSVPVGAITEGLRGQLGDRVITVAAMTTPEPQTPPNVLPRCEAVAFVQPGYIHGFVSHVAAPTVPGATAVQALRMSATVTTNGHETETVQYAYIASLDDRHVVSVTFSGTPLLGGPGADIDPEPAKHLLIEAARVLRQ